MRRCAAAMAIGTKTAKELWSLRMCAFSFTELGNEVRILGPAEGTRDEVIARVEEWIQKPDSEISKFVRQDRDIDEFALKRAGMRGYYELYPRDIDEFALKRAGMNGYYELYPTIIINRT